MFNGYICVKATGLLEVNFNIISHPFFFITQNGGGTLRQIILYIRNNITFHIK